MAFLYAFICILNTSLDGFSWEFLTKVNLLGDGAVILFRRRVTKDAKLKVQNVATKQKSFLVNNVRTTTWTDANSNHMFRGLRNLNITWTGSTVYWHEGEFQPCVCWSVTASHPGSHQSVPQNLHVEFPVSKLQLYKSSTIISIVIQLLNKESAEKGLRPQYCFSLWILFSH